MKRLIAAAGFLFVIPMFAPAQDADGPARAQGYLFIGPLVSNTRYVTNPAYYGVVFTPGMPFPPDLTFHEHGGVNAGFGGEFFVRKGLAVGPEFAYAGPDWSFSTGAAVGVGSFDASYHFLGRKTRRRLEPFVTGGYSLYFGDRTVFQNGLNLGGGVNFWVAKHVALRLEIRDQDHINYFHSQFTRFVAFRVGMTFR
jgi:opacity protein-like surface antigen